MKMAHMNSAIQNRHKCTHLPGFSIRDSLGRNLNAMDDWMTSGSGNWAYFLIGSMGSRIDWAGGGQGGQGGQDGKQNRGAFGSGQTVDSHESPIWMSPHNIGTPDPVLQPFWVVEVAREAAC